MERGYDGRMRNILMATTVLVSGCLPPTPKSDPIVRNDIVTQSRAIDGVTIEARPFGAKGWMIGLKNETPDTVRIVWDESTYVNPAGASLGRLIRGETRLMHSGQAQPSTPVAPGATVIEWCLPEGQISKYSPDNPSSGMGRIVLTVDTVQGKKTWEGAVWFDGNSVATTPDAGAPELDAGPVVDAGVDAQ